MRFLPIIALLFFPFLSQAQIEKIHENLEKDAQNKSSHTTYSHPNIDNSHAEVDAACIEGCFNFLIGTGILVDAISRAQTGALSKLEMYPKRVSFEIPAHVGIAYHDDALYSAQAVQVNYGIVASELKLIQLTDLSGDINTVNWQILKLRIPIKNFIIEYGLGFSSVLQTNLSYFESSIGVDFTIPRAKVTITSHYRWTEITSLDTRFRQIFECGVDYDVFQYKAIHVCPGFAYSRHNYFDASYFNFISAGITLRFY